MPIQDAEHVADQACDLGRRPGFCRFEDSDDAFANRPAALAVAATRGLSELVEAGFRTPYLRKINVYTGFDKGGCDNTARLLFLKSLTHVCKNLSPVLRCLSGCQM